jgi:hypothetical protein
MTRPDKFESITHRECLKCRIIKPLDEFHKNSQQGFKKHVYCKTCRSIALKKYRDKKKGDI